MERKILAWIIIGALGLLLILISLNPGNAIDSGRNEVSYDGIKIDTLSVYDYRPIFISSLGERRYFIDNIDEIKALVMILDRTEPTKWSFKDDFGKYDFQVSINEDTGDILFCFRISDEKNEVFIEKWFDTKKVYKLREKDIEEFRKIFEQLEG